jgi:transposase
VQVSHLHSNNSASWRTDACIKLSVVASDIFGVSGRAMMAALIAGQRDPQVLAAMARARMRVKIPRLEEAFAGLPLGTFDDHHRFLLSRMLARIDAVSADIAAVEAEIGDHLALSLTRSPGLMRSPGLGRMWPRSSSPRSAWT